jgi:hypothetical protein
LGASKLQRKGSFGSASAPGLNIAGSTTWILSVGLRFLAHQIGHRLKATESGLAVLRETGRQIWAWLANQRLHPTAAGTDARRPRVSRGR